MAGWQRRGWRSPDPQPGHSRGDAHTGGTLEPAPDGIDAGAVARYGPAVAVEPRRRLTVECPRCGRCYEEWPVPAPDLELDPELADPGFLAACATSTCPHCGYTACRPSQA